jgi:hypothetical protein
MKMRIAVTFLALSSFTALAAPPSGYCEVEVCNKLERFSLSPWKHLKDKIGESCTPGILARQDAVVGKELSSESRWYQGGFNPTKKSVSRVKAVKVCTP